MKREIEFRGKPAKGEKAKGEWVYGDLVRIPDGDCFDCYIVSDFDERDSIYELWKYAIKVIPETVGQYTGIKDKNGKKIFEHDIVYIKFQEPTSKVTGKKPIYTIIFEKGCFSLFRKINRIVVFDLRVWYKECEVIGTVFDKEKRQ